MIRAVAARERGSVLAPVEIGLRALRPGEVEGAVEQCALCYSDIHLVLRMDL